MPAFCLSGEGPDKHRIYTLWDYGQWVRASLVAQRWRICLPMQEAWVRSLGQEDPLEKEMAIHSNILAWEVPWTEEPGGLQSWGCKESDSTYQLNNNGPTGTFTFCLSVQRTHQLRVWCLFFQNVCRETSHGNKKTKDAWCTGIQVCGIAVLPSLFNNSKQVSGEPGKQKWRTQSTELANASQQQRKWLLIRSSCSACLFEWMVTNTEPGPREGKSNRCGNERHPPPLADPDPEDLGLCMCYRAELRVSGSGWELQPQASPVRTGLTHWIWTTGLLQPAGPSSHPRFCPRALLHTGPHLPRLPRICHTGSP